MNRRVYKAIYNIHYHVYSIINKILPKKKNYIFIYDAPFMRQNCWAFYKYLIQRGYNKNYRIFYYSERYNDHYGEALKSGIISNPIKGWILHLISKYTFYEYHNFKFCCKPGKNQISVYLMHGMPFKKYGYLLEEPEHPFEDDYTYLLVTCNYYISVMKKCLGCSNDQIYLGGMPRCDQLFHTAKMDWIIKPGKKNILWMPTFRKSKENNIDDSESDFPLLSSENIAELDRVLEEENVFMIIKPHPLQDRIEWLYDRKYKNIRIVLNQELDANNTELYELIGATDMLLTDYSSVYSDYLLTLKPIVFTIDDFDEYKQNRGFVDESLLDELPGPIVNDFNALVDSIGSIDRIDKEYLEARKKSKLKLTPISKNGSFSEDLCEFLGIKP